MTTPHSFWNAPQPYMGFSGFVRVISNGGISHSPFLIRTTGGGINLSQEITKPDLIDSRYDKSSYQVGPKIVGGTLDFPALYDASGDMFTNLYYYAVSRDISGKLYDFDAEIKYAGTDRPFNDSEFTYTGCVVNSWTFSVAHQDNVKCSLDLIGVDRVAPDINPMQSPARDPDDYNDYDCQSQENTGNGMIGNTRVITWNDARVEISGDELGDSVGGQFIRTFEAKINNDVERYYTLNTLLAAQALAPRKRDIEGSIEVMGRHPGLAQAALSNEERCKAFLNVKFGFISPQSSTCPSTGFNVTFPNSILFIEEMSLQNDVLVTTHSWTSMPNAGLGVCDPLLTSIGKTTFDYEDLR